MTDTIEITDGELCEVLQSEDMEALRDDLLDSCDPEHRHSVDEACELIGPLAVDLLREYGLTVVEDTATDRLRSHIRALEDALEAATGSSVPF